jgi:hypothetical protein
MKTKEFIKMLQEADPSGEAHIRMSGGVPFYAELKEGYWDGPYSYIDEEGNYIYTTQGMKVDLYQKDIQDFASDFFNLHNPKRNNWESLKNKFKFNCGISKEREESILEKAKKAFEESKEIEENLYNQYYKEMINNAIKGWTWFQNKDVDKNEKPNYHIYYTWKIYDENGKEMGSNVKMTESVKKSGVWEKLDNNVKPGYYEWVFKNNK